MPSYTSYTYYTTTYHSTLQDIKKNNSYSSFILTYDPNINLPQLAIMEKHMEKIITQFSRLLWSILNILSRGSLQDGEDGLSGYLRNTKRVSPILSVFGLRVTWLAANDEARHDKTPAFIADAAFQWPFIVSAPEPGTSLIYWQVKNFTAVFLPEWTRRRKNTEKKPQPNRRGGAAEVRPLVCVFIGPWINMAFLIQKGLAATESEYLSLPPGAGVQRQGRCW